MKHTARLGFAAMIVLATPAGAADLCEDVAAQIRQGALDNLNHKDLNRSLLDQLAEVAPQLVKLNQSDWTNTVPAPFPRPEDEQSVMYQPLGKSGVTVIGGMSGSMRCENYKFFTVKGKKAITFPPPAMLQKVGELCWNDWARTGTVAGTPTVFWENDAQKYRRMLAFTPLQQGKWGRQCHMEVSYRPDLRMSGSACKTGTCPSQLGELALLIARRHENKLAQPDEIQGKQTRKIRELLEDSDRLLPGFKTGFSNGYLKFWNDSKMIPLKLNGRLSIAMVGGGWWGWREFPGLLVGFWQMEGDQLVPLAGFQVLYDQNKVTRVSVSH